MSAFFPYLASYPCPLGITRVLAVAGLGIFKSYTFRFRLIDGGYNSALERVSIRHNGQHELRHKAELASWL